MLCQIPVGRHADICVPLECHALPRLPIAYGCGEQSDFREVETKLCERAST